LLKLGWLHFNAKNNRKALSHYRAAYKLSDGGTEPLLGIAWCRFRLGEREAAERLFAKVLQQDPGNESAKQGLELCKLPPITPWKYGATLRGSLHTYSDHPRKDWALSTTVGAEIIKDETYRLAATFRYIYFRLDETTLYTTVLWQRRRRGGWSTSTTSYSEKKSYGQVELYLAAGVTYPEYDIMGHFAIADDDGELDTVYGFGASGRLRIPYGNLLGEISFSDYDDDEVFRTAVAWDAPLSEEFSVRPGVAFQANDDDTFFTGFVTVEYHGPWGRVYAGAKVGEEFRPLYLNQPSFYNVIENIDGGFWIGASLTLDDHWSLDAAYESYSLEYDVEGVEYDSDMHLGTLGFTGRF
jgi:hypothetical protein